MFRVTTCIYIYDAACGMKLFLIKFGFITLDFSYSCHFA